MALEVRCVIRTRVNSLAFATYVSILTIAFLSNQCETSKGADADLIIVKLDKILEIVGNLSAKYDHLEKIIIQRNKNYKHDTEDLRQNPSTSTRPESSNLKGKDSSLYLPAEDSSNQLEGPKETYKREGEDGRVPGKDLFHFNKLAPNSNVIPSSSIPWTSKDEGDLNEWLVSSPGQYLQHEQRQMMSSIGQQYEIMFGNALDNLNSVLKEQLAGFKLTLNKLMNRLMDHSYQYNMVVNQLSLIKDECSLAASCNQNERDFVDNRRHDKIGETSATESIKTPTINSPQIGSQMRTSDISMMVKLISSEISHMLHQSRLRGFDIEQLDQSALGKILNDTRLYMTKKLNEIDSVVKQSAIFLTKLNTKLPQLISIEKPVQGQKEITITYNNSMGSEFKTQTIALEPAVTIEAALTTLETQAPQNSRPKSTRWFPGSKIPASKSGQPNVFELSRSDQSVLLGNNQQSEQQLRPRCQSKTNLTLPSSCEQLRLYGANCTGQYYVFVRGEIRHIYCDMNADNEEGWTVILRRLDKSLKDYQSGNQTEVSGGNIMSSPDNSHNQSSRVVPTRGSNQLLEALKASQLNFNLDWLKYKNGFGQLNDWAEFFIGLDLLHQLTNDPSNQTVTELQIDFETNRSNELHLKFDHFHISNEESQYKVSIGACNESLRVCEPMIAINGSRFYTFDRNETTTTTITSNETNCDTKNQGGESDDSQLQPRGWWLPEWLLNLEKNSCNPAEADDFVTLTKPIGKRKRVSSSAMQPEAGELASTISHIYWPNWEHSSEPLRRVVMKVHRKRLAGVSLPKKRASVD